MSNAGSELPATNRPVRSVAILGVGNRLRGDDAVGCIVCDELQKPGPSSFVPSPSSVPVLYVFDCGSTPENYVQPVADRKPTRILVIDCCNFGARPGEFRLFSREEVKQLSYGLLSTHTLPLTLTIEMLSLETGATIELLGIQPQQIEFGAELSPAVQAALPALVQFTSDWAHPSRSAQPA
jgi:hydrogenase 3 maturation protease